MGKESIMIKNPKPPAQARIIKRLQKQLDLASELRESEKHAHLKYRDHAAQTLAEHLAKIRNLELVVEELKDHAIKDAFRLNDYRDQLAIQYRMVAEAKQDATNAISNLQHWKNEYTRASNTIDELANKNTWLKGEVAYFESIACGSIWSFIKRRIKERLNA